MVKGKGIMKKALQNIKQSFIARFNKNIPENFKEVKKVAITKDKFKSLKELGNGLILCQRNDNGEKFIIDNNKMWDCSFQDIKEFDENVAPVQLEDGSWTFINKNGLISTYRFKSMDNFKNGIVRVQLKDGSWSIVSRLGRLQNTSFKEIDEFKNGFAKVQFEDGSWSIINREGVVSKERFKSIKQQANNLYDELFVVEMLDGTGTTIYNSNGKIFEGRYDSIENISNGMITFKKNDKFGVMDYYQNESKIECDKPLNAKEDKGIFIIEPGYSYFQVDNGSDVTKLKLRDVESLIYQLDDNVVVSTEDDLFTIVNNKEGKICEEHFTEIKEPEFGLFFCVTKDNTIAFVNTDCKVWSEKFKDADIDELGLIQTINQDDSISHYYYNGYKFKSKEEVEFYKSVVKNPNSYKDLPTEMFKNKDFIDTLVLAIGTKLDKKIEAGKITSKDLNAYEATKALIQEKDKIEEANIKEEQEKLEAERKEREAAEAERLKKEQEEAAKKEEEERKAAEAERLKKEKEEAAAKKAADEKAKKEQQKIEKKRQLEAKAKELSKQFKDRIL